MARPSRPESLELLKQSQSGNLKARDEFFELNQPIVKYLAKRLERPETDIEDLMQEGGLALLKCMQSFDFSKNLQFSTYAMPYIYGHLQNFVKTNTLIPPQRQFHDSAMKWWREKARLKRDGMDDVSDEMVNQAFNWGEGKIRYINLHGNMVNNAPDSLDEVMRNYENGGNNDLTLADMVPAKEEATLDAMVKEEDAELLHKEVGKLKEKWQKVMIIRHGLDDGYFKSLQEVGDLLGLSKERIRQIEEVAIEKLREGLK